MDRFQVINNEMKIEDKSIPTQIAPILYEDTLEGIYTCDLIIKCGKNLFEYSAHRIILAAASEFLYETLSTAIPGTISVLILPDIEPKTLKQVLRYVYNGEIELDMTRDYHMFIEACELLKIPRPTFTEKQMNYPNCEENESTTDEMPEIKEVVIDLISDSEDEGDFSSSPPIMEPIAELMRPLNNIPLFQNSIEFMESKEKNEPKAGKCQKIRKRRMESTERINLSSLTNNETEKLLDKMLERAKRCVQFVYKTSNRKPLDESLNAVVNETRLIYDGMKIKKASHKCAFCKKELSLHMAKNKGFFNNNSLREHLRRRHNVLNTNKND